MKKKNNLRNFIFILLVACLAISSMPKNYYAFNDDDPEYYMQGKGNTSTTYYKWIQIKSLDAVESIIAQYGENTEYRCMILSYEDNYDEHPSEICIIDREDYWDDRFIKPNLNDVSGIKYREEIFYTRGGLMTPYIKFLGRDTHSLVGEGYKVELYAANRSDEKTKWQICNTPNDGDSRLILRNNFNGLYFNYRAYGYWMMTFPAQNKNDYMGIAAYGEDYVSFAMPIQKDDRDYDSIVSNKRIWLTSDYPNWADYYLENTPSKSSVMGDKEKIFFKTYIGIPIEQNVVGEKDTINIPSGTTVAWENSSVNDGTIYIEDGGTLIISGTCINNGRIFLSKGAKLIIQKGALVMPLEPRTQNNACIDAVLGGTIIIREGARVVGMEKATQQYMIKVGGQGTIVNYGYIIGNDVYMYKSSSARYIKSGSGQYKTCSSFDLKEGECFMAGYDRGDPYYSMDDYIERIHIDSYSVIPSSGAGTSGSW